jgi:hypothetical protein
MPVIFENFGSLFVSPAVDPQGRFTAHGVRPLHAFFLMRGSTFSFSFVHFCDLCPGLGEIFILHSSIRLSADADVNVSCYLLEFPASGFARHAIAENPCSAFRNSVKAEI